MTASHAAAGSLDVAVVGAGLYGATIARELARRGRHVTLIEREDGLLRRASIFNQARVHGGYHYPRSLQTGVRSQLNYRRFVRDYSAAVDPTIRSVYAIARVGSRVTGAQFARFCERIDAPVERIPGPGPIAMDGGMIEAAFLVREATFDAVRLASILEADLADAAVDVVFSTSVERIDSAGGEIVLIMNGPHGRSRTAARDVVVCAYAGTNALLERSGLPALPLRYQDTEMVLVKLPRTFEGLAVTVMDGPYFSVLPYPTRPGLHTLSHVRFTPRVRHVQGAAVDEHEMRRSELSAFPYMITDARRYVPDLGAAIYIESIREAKVFPATADQNDGRPILIHRSAEIPGLQIVVGGKIDNVYDIADELQPSVSDVRPA